MAQAATETPGGADATGPATPAPESRQTDRERAEGGHGTPDPVADPPDPEAVLARYLAAYAEAHGAGGPGVGSGLREMPQGGWPLAAQAAARGLAGPGGWSPLRASSVGVGPEPVPGLPDQQHAFGLTRSLPGLGATWDLPGSVASARTPAGPLGAAWAADPGSADARAAGGHARRASAAADAPDRGEQRAAGSHGPAHGPAEPPPDPAGPSAPHLAGVSADHPQPAPAVPPAPPPPGVPASATPADLLQPAAIPAAIGPTDQPAGPGQPSTAVAGATGLDAGTTGQPLGRLPAGVGGRDADSPGQDEPASPGQLDPAGHRATAGQGSPDQPSRHEAAAGTGGAHGTCGPAPDGSGATRPGEAWAHHGAAFADADPRDVSYPAPVGLAHDLVYPESDGPPHGLAGVLQSLLEFSGTAAPLASILADIGLIQPEHLPAAAGTSVHPSGHDLPPWLSPESLGLPTVGAAHDVPHAGAHPDVLARTDHAFDAPHPTHPVPEP